MYWILSTAPTVGVTGQTLIHPVAADITITAVFGDGHGVGFRIVEVEKAPETADGTVSWTYVHEGVTVTGGIGTFNMPAATELILNATDGPNFGFMYWIVSDEPQDGIADRPLRHEVLGDVTITAIYGHGTELRNVIVAKDPANAAGIVSWTYEHGSVTVTGGTGTFNMPMGTELELSATDGPNFGFMYWTLSTKTGIGISDRIIEHEVLGNVTITAFFGDNGDLNNNYRSVTVETDPAAAEDNVSWTYMHNGNTVTGGAGTFNMPLNASVTLTATDSVDYGFMYWTKSTAPLVGISERTIEHDVTENITITAVFGNENEFRVITVEKEPETTDGTVSWRYTHNNVVVTGGIGVFNMPYGTEVEFTATDGQTTYVFRHWNFGGPRSTNGNKVMEHTTYESITITAVFEEYVQSPYTDSLTIVMHPTDSDGRVTWTYIYDGELHTGFVDRNTGPVTLSLPRGTIVSLTAWDGTDFVFLYWTKNTSPGMGTSGEDLDHIIGGTVILTAVFGDNTGGDLTTFRMVTVAMHPVIADGNVSWTYEYNGHTVTGGVGTFNMPFNVDLRLTATDGPNFGFMYWIVSDEPLTGIPDRTIEHEVLGNVMITAVYGYIFRTDEARIVTVAKESAAADGTVEWTYVHGDVIVTGGVGTFNMPLGVTLELIATDGDYFGFMYWTLSTDTSVGIPRNDLDHGVLENITITAVFGDNTNGHGTEFWIVTVETDPEEVDGNVTWTYVHGTVTVTGGVGTFNMPADVTLELTATDGEYFGFMYWMRSTVPDTGVSGNVLLHTISEDITITAVFGDNTDGHGTEFWIVTVETHPREAYRGVTWTYVHGTVTVTGGTGTFNMPVNVTLDLVATDHNRWVFSEWYGDVTGTEPIISTEIDGDKTAGAIFDHQQSRWFWWHPLLILIAALTFKILWLAIWKNSAYGIVWHEGERVKGAVVAYTVNGDDKFVLSDKKGRYVLEAPTRSNIAIVSVTKDKMKAIEELPVKFKMENRKERDFNIE